MTEPVFGSSATHPVVDPVVAAMLNETRARRVGAFVRPKTARRGASGLISEFSSYEYQRRGAPLPT